jgi:Flp pilus assembly protein TadD
MVYKVLMLLLMHRQPGERMAYLALTAALIFTAHPIHTEVVANIKGRDEIMGMLGSVVALYFIIRYVDTQKFQHMIWAMLALFTGLLAKENAITFLAVIPLALYYFRKLPTGNVITYSAYLMLPILVFLGIRTAILGFDFGGTPMELMNNPFLKMVDGRYVPFSSGEKWATIIHTLGQYVQLLVFPHPLTHDYYPRHIGIMNFGQLRVWLDVLMYGFLIFIAVKGFSKKSIISFSVLYYFITLSIVSNIVFPIGTLMSERFMFMPSLGFALVMGYLLVTFVYDMRGKTALMSVGVILILLYGLKTITRNQVWESDFVLFTTDVHTSKNSAKVLNAAGGSLVDRYGQHEDENIRRTQLKQALQYLNQAIRIHPLYKNAYLLQGNAHFFLGSYEEAVSSYDNALKIDPQYNDALKNLTIALREAGKKAGEKENNLPKATLYLERAYRMAPEDMETVRLLGVLNGVQGRHEEALTFFRKVADAFPDNARALMDLSTAYRNMGDLKNAEFYLQKAYSLDPSIINGR